MLRIDWYLEQPHDFEYKNYILLDYVQSIDKSYQIHKLSPYLLWTEKMVYELRDFEVKKQQFLKSVEKRELKVLDGKLAFTTIRINEIDEIKTISEIVEYSTPILLSKIKLGYKLLDKYPQILF